MPRRRPRPLARALGCALALLVARDALATPPAKDWEIEIAPYGWLAMARGEADTPIGDQKFTIDAGDVISSLDIGAMGAVKGRWRRWVALVDVAWAKLTDEGGAGNTLVRYDLQQELGWLEALGGYRVYDRPGGLFDGSDRQTFAIDLMAGITYTWIETDLHLHRNPVLPIPPQSRHFRVDRDWVAPYLAGRFTNDWTERIRHETLLGLGGFGVGDAPNLGWQVSSTLSYALSERWLISLGYRALGLRDPDFHTTFHGPLLGLGFRF